MNLETKDCDLDLLVELEEADSHTIYGARDSLGGRAGMGPPIEPDETQYSYSIKQVRLADVEITQFFDTSETGDEERMYELVVEGIEKIGDSE